MCTRQVVSDAPQAEVFPVAAPESQKASLKSEIILLMRQPLIDQRTMGNLVIIKGSQDLDHLDLDQTLTSNLQDQDHDL